VIKIICQITDNSAIGTYLCLSLSGT
jgi:hypothetical protein